MIQGVIFDMDGVLADTEHFYQTRRDEFLDRMDFTGPRGLNFVGSNEKAIWETLVPDDPVFRQQMLQGYRAYRRLHPENYAQLADPEARPLFEELKRRGIKIGIASSSERAGILALIACAGLKGLPDFVISGEECTAHKPSPEIYLRALAGLDLQAGDAFAVEDSPTGIAAAKSAGLTVYALRPRHGEPLDQRAADGILPRLAAVREVLGWRE